MLLYFKYNFYLWFFALSSLILFMGKDVINFLISLFLKKPATDLSKLTLQKQAVSENGQPVDHTYKMLIDRFNTANLDVDMEGGL